MSVETTRLHGIIARLTAIADELYDMGHQEAEYSVNDAIDTVQWTIEELKNE